MRPRSTARSAVTTTIGSPGRSRRRKRCRGNARRYRNRRFVTDVRLNCRGHPVRINREGGAIPVRRFPSLRPALRPPIFIGLGGFFWHTIYYWWKWASFLLFNCSFAVREFVMVGTQASGNRFSPWLVAFLPLVVIAALARSAAAKSSDAEQSPAERAKSIRSTCRRIGLFAKSRQCASQSSSPDKAHGGAHRF